jgi:hypothetical protein
MFDGGDLDSCMLARRAELAGAVCGVPRWADCDGKSRLAGSEHK